MRKFKFLSYGLAIVSASIIGLTGCGGGSSSSIVDTTPMVTSISGGTASSPALMSLDLNNEISSNNFYNYFKYVGTEDEKLIIHVTLDDELSRDQKVNCSVFVGREEYTFIAVYDSNLNWLEDYHVCGNDLTVTFPTDTTYIFKFQYSSNFYGPQTGYFNAASVMP